MEKRTRELDPETGYKVSLSDLTIPGGRASAGVLPCVQQGPGRLHHCRGDEVSQE